MLFPFVSTRPRYTAQPVVLLLSITAHVILIYLAFAPRPPRGRTASGDLARDRPVSVERIRYVAMEPPPERSTTVRPKPVKREIKTPVFTQIRAMSIDHIAIAEPTAVSTIDLSARVNDADSSAAPVARVADLVKGIIGAPSVGAHNGAYDKAEVDRIVSPFANNPKPIYPRRMEREGVETSFIAQFVVDSTGRVDDTTMLFPPEVNRLFIDSVRESLRRARFYPAEVAGRRVRQLVEQQFTFALVQGGRENQLRQR
jgi:outer membrane biosynthesis protein TonB